MDSHEPQPCFLASTTSFETSSSLVLGRRTMCRCVGEMMRVYSPITMQVPFLNHNKSNPACQDNSVRDTYFQAFHDIHGRQSELPFYAL